MMRPILLAVACMMSIIAGAGQSHATVITFDDLHPDSDSNNPIDSYQGFTWDNFYFLDGKNYRIDDTTDSGFYHGVVSENNVAYNGNGNTAFLSDSSFTFNSAYFAAAWRDNLSILVQGYSGDSPDPKEERTITVHPTDSTFVQFDWHGIDKLVFSSSGGSFYWADGYQFVMDDFDFTEEEPQPIDVVPEPSTLAIWSVLGGLGITAGWRRRPKAA